MREYEEVIREIEACRKAHGYRSCGECPIRLGCFLLDELDSLRRRR